MNSLKFLVLYLRVTEIAGFNAISGGRFLARSDRAALETLPRPPMPGWSRARKPAPVGVADTNARLCLQSCERGRVVPSALFNSAHARNARRSRRVLITWFLAGGSCFMLHASRLLDS
jgi:hypothetical protein